VDWRGCRCVEPPPPRRAADFAKADVLPALATLTQLERLAMFVPSGHQGDTWREPNAVCALSALTGLTSLTACAADRSSFDAWARAVRSMRQLRELQVQMTVHLPGEPLLKAIGGLPRLRALRLVLSQSCCWSDPPMSERSADALRKIPDLELHCTPKVRTCVPIAPLMRLPNLKLTTWWSYEPAHGRWLATTGPGACCCWDCMPRGGRP
jgi:hypothetical protein